MVKEKKRRNKSNRKIFIEETIGTRQYFSYRADLMLYKLILCLLLFAVINNITSHLVFSFFISTQMFVIFTLINKLNLERKEKEGKKKLITKAKKEYFKRKIDDIEINGFENLIQFFFVGQKYTNYNKIGEHSYSAELNGVVSYIKVIKLFDGAEVDRIDAKNFISLVSQSNIKSGFLITNKKINDEAKDLIDKIKGKIQIEIIDIDKLYNLAEEFDLLPENKYFYNKILNEKQNKKNRNLIKNNMLSDKKIIIYIFSAVLFYIISKIIPYNILTLYISYYFILLASLSVLYNIYLKLSIKKRIKL